MVDSSGEDIPRLQERETNTDDIREGCMTTDFRKTE